MGRFEVFFSGPAKEAAGASGSPAYWDDIESRHRDHRAMTRNLLIVSAVIVALGVFVATPILNSLLFVVPLLLLQALLTVRSRPG